jgi:hypothetical protein
MDPVDDCEEPDCVELGFLEPADGENHLDFNSIEDWDGGKVGGRPVRCVLFIVAHSACCMGAETTCQGCRLY